MLTTSFTELTGCKVPIQQAGMGGVGTAQLAAAVADAGALGMVALHGAPAGQVAAALDELAATTDGVVGMNFLMPFIDEAAVEAAATRCRVVEFFYGDPAARLVERVQAGGALACWQVGSADEARAAADAGCDLIAAQGTEAGGHVRGELALLPLLDAVLDRVRIPVLAAGGIATARGVAAVLAAGAAGARVGTRFVASAESNAHPGYIRAILAAGGADTMITETFCVGWPNAPHRVLRSCVDAACALDGDVAAEVTVGQATRSILKFGPETPGRETAGRIDAMALYAGESVGAVRSVRPAGEIVRELASGAERLLGAWT